MAALSLKNIKFDRRTVMIGVGLTAATAATVILIRRKTFGKKLSAYISSKLEGRTNLYGNIKDFEDVFSGKSYLEKVESKVKQEYPTLAFIKLKDEFVTKYRTDLYKAMEGGVTGWGTEEESVKGVFKNLKDKVAVAQVAESYKKAYGRNLLDVLQDEMDVNGDDMKEINDDISVKLPFRLTKKTK